MIKASEARIKANSVTEGTNSAVIADIEKQVLEAVRNGKLSINYYKEVPDAVKKALEKDGYTVTYYGALTHRWDESYTVIS